MTLPPMSSIPATPLSMFRISPTRILNPTHTTLQTRTMATHATNTSLYKFNHTMYLPPPLPPSPH